VEKAAEGKKLGVGLPELSAYHPLAKALAQDVGTHKIFLQTASPVGLQDFAAFARKQALEVSYTDNPRSEHDSWGGWQHGTEMLQSAIGAVNAYVASHAAITASPFISIWTEFLRYTVPWDQGTTATIKARCPPSRSAFSIFGPRARQLPMSALQRTCDVGK